MSCENPELTPAAVAALAMVRAVTRAAVLALPAPGWLKTPIPVSGSPEAVPAPSEILVNVDTDTFGGTQMWTFTFADGSQHWTCDSSEARMISEKYFHPGPKSNVGERNFPKYERHGNGRWPHCG